jgi:hypothetical protein
MDIISQPHFETVTPDRRELIAQQKLSEALDALIRFEDREKTEHNSWIDELGGALVDNIILAIHDFATSKGINPEDAESRLDIAKHFDAHLRNGGNPLRGLETSYDFISCPVTETITPSEVEVQSFSSYQISTDEYATAAMVGYEALADL